MAAADAYAQGQSAGIGGWWMLPSDGICPASFFWFSIAVQAAELPDWFVQEHGRFAEIHLRARSFGPARAQRVVDRGQSSWSNVLVCRTGGATTKLRQFEGLRRCQQGFVCAATVGDVLQTMATLCMQRQVFLQVSHVAGQRNTWADLLSRGRAGSDSQKFWRH